MTLVGYDRYEKDGKISCIVTVDLGPLTNSPNHTRSGRQIVSAYAPSEDVDIFNDKMIGKELDYSYHWWNHKLYLAKNHQ